MSSPRTYSAKYQRLSGGKATGILQQIRGIATCFVGNPIQLVPQPQTEGEIPSDLPRVLAEKVVLMLPVELVVRGLPCSALVKELRLRILNNQSIKSISTIDKSGTGIVRGLIGHNAGVVTKTPERIQCELA